MTGKKRNTPAVIRLEILKALTRPMTREELAKVTGYQITDVRREVSELVRGGQLWSVHRGGGKVELRGKVAQL